MKDSVLTFYVDGAGLLTPALPDGSIAAQPLAKPVLPVSVTIGGKPATILYAGSAPGLVAGIIQVNCIVPAGLTDQINDIVVQVGQTASNPGFLITN